MTLRLLQKPANTLHCRQLLKVAMTLLNRQLDTAMVGMLAAKVKQQSLQYSKLIYVSLFNFQ